MSSCVPTRRGVLIGAATTVLAVPSRGQAFQTRAPSVAPTHVRVETVTGGVEFPWGLQFLPGGRFLVTERPGRIRIIARDGAVSPPLTGVPKVAATGQGGMLDVALAPDYMVSGLVYFAYAEPREGGRNGTTVARARLRPDGERPGLDTFEVIFRQLPEFAGGLHFGCRLAFASDGKLFVTLGERFQKEGAQDLTRHWGKVVRLNPDGSVPADNPFVGRSDARPEIWSYGHRNPQSAAIHPETGKLWIVEHGPQGGDEINVPLRGRNYGWPVIGYGIDYSGARLHATTQRAGMEQPIYYWAPSIAPSGMAFYDGAAFPGWRGNLLVGALAGRALHRLVLDGERVVGEEVLLLDQGRRIRDVRVAVDGRVYLLTDSADGQLLRLVP
ncbi:MAG: PQQ-dependent sugar dehydrogenase [Hyphomicrobiaceae bacterium]